MMVLQEQRRYESQRVMRAWDWPICGRRIGPVNGTLDATDSSRSGAHKRRVVRSGMSRKHHGRRAAPIVVSCDVKLR
jgi:hypothetical protein